jgi:hypothetical protein
MLAVDLGTGDEPSWFAPEDLQIVPYQIWARVIPDAVANDFHRIACKTPGDTRSCTELESLAELPRNLTGLSANTNTHANAQLAPLVGRSISCEVNANHRSDPMSGCQAQSYHVADPCGAATIRYGPV